MRAVISVVGKDRTGILAKVSGKCFELNANIVDVTQTILEDLFVMVMLAEIDRINCDYQRFVALFTELAEENGLKIHVMNEDIFNAMHRI
ncbi:MAG: ACT domain-containing protein [Firmicutes bacterium]|nr:ACT domain-containing protein [Bacillota bacterium]